MLLRIRLRRMIKSDNFGDYKKALKSADGSFRQISLEADAVANQLTALWRIYLQPLEVVFCVSYLVSQRCCQVLVANKAYSESDPKGWMSQLFQETTEAAGQLATLNQNFADQVRELACPEHPVLMLNLLHLLH